MKKALQETPKTACLLDDIIVAGTDDQELELLERVLGHLGSYH